MNSFSFFKDVKQQAGYDFQARKAKAVRLHNINIFNLLSLAE